MTVENPSVELIPRPNSKICPKNTQYKVTGETSSMGTCRCEQHCAWDLCRLTIPPKDCLLGIVGRWMWDSLKNAWVAQENQGNIVDSRKDLEIKLLFVRI